MQKEFYNIGTAKYNIKDYNGAFVDFDLAISINPNFCVALNNRSCANKKLGNNSSSFSDKVSSWHASQKNHARYF